MHHLKPSNQLRMLFTHLSHANHVLITLNAQKISIIWNINNVSCQFAVCSCTEEYYTRKMTNVIINELVISEIVLFVAYLYVIFLFFCSRRYGNVGSLFDLN